MVTSVLALAALKTLPTCTSPVPHSRSNLPHIGDSRTRTLSDKSRTAAQAILALRCPLVTRIADSSFMIVPPASSG